MKSTWWKSVEEIGEVWWGLLKVVIQAVVLGWVVHSIVSYVGCFMLPLIIMVWAISH